MTSHNELVASMIQRIRGQYKDWAESNEPEDDKQPVWGDVSACLHRIDDLERLIKDYVVECEKNLAEVGGCRVPDDDHNHAWAAYDALKCAVPPDPVEMVPEKPKPGPCPWCHHVTGGVQEDCGYFWFVCGEDGDCSAAGPMRHSKEEAIEAWNQISGWREVLEEIVEITLPSDSINKSARTALKRGP